MSLRDEERQFEYKHDAAQEYHYEMAMRESEESGICMDCHGSGEGLHDDTACPTCKGKGELQ